jgi:hypothetical protein
LIICDDFASAARANYVLQHSAWSVDFPVLWNVSPWRVDMLKFPPTAEEALTDALDAHLITIADLSAQSLPFRFQGWLDHWAKCRRVNHSGEQRDRHHHQQPWLAARGFVGEDRRRVVGFAAEVSWLCSQV